MALYGLLDWDLLEKYQLSLEQFLKGAKGLKVKILQYRDKKAPLEVKAQRLQQIGELWDGILIVNDQVQLLPLADGIHLGQEDLRGISHRSGLPPEEVLERLRRGEEIPFYPYLPGTRHSRRGRLLKRQLGVNRHLPKIVGLSTHNFVEVAFANNYPLSYIGLGAYRSTSTKEGAEPIPREELERLLKLSRHPVAVIGGVRLSDKIAAKFRVVGSDLCRYISTQLRKNRHFRRR